MPAPAPAPATAPPELIELARRLFWWKPPAEALRWPERFLAQVMTLGTWEDVQTARRFWSDEDFRAALPRAPAGVFDPRSWSYWRVRLGLHPVPPLPRRQLP